MKASSTPLQRFLSTKYNKRSRDYIYTYITNFKMASMRISLLVCVVVVCFGLLEALAVKKPKENANAVPELINEKEAKEKKTCNPDPYCE